jgi:hypothetical protein
MGSPAVPEPPVSVLEERRFDPPRRVDVQHNGSWHLGYQRAWRLCDDTRGWTAEVRWSEPHDWSLGTHDTMAAPEQLRLPSDQVCASLQRCLMRSAIRVGTDHR